MRILVTDLEMTKAKRDAKIRKLGRTIAQQIRRSHRPVDWPRSAPCPATDTSTCQGDHSRDGTCGGGGCQTWICHGCGLARPWCVGTERTPLCDACAVAAEEDR